MGLYTHAGVELTPSGIPGFTSRSDFNLFFGTKGDDVPVDFSAKTMFVPANAGDHPTYPSGVAKAHNFCTGVVQAWKQLEQGIDFPDPDGGFPGMHLTRADTEALITNLEADQGPGSYYVELYSNDATYRDVWDAFADDTNTEAATVIQYCLDYIKCGVDNYVNKGSLAEPYWLYWQGGLRFQEMAIRATAMVSLHQVRPFITSLQKRQLKALLSTIGHIVWDNNFVPAENSEVGQFTFGTSNMPIQYNQQKNQLTCLLKTHPQFLDRFATMLARTVASFESGVSVNGAPYDSPHYAGTLVVPALDVFRQLQVSDYEDLFAPGSSTYDRLVLLGQYFLQLMTPPQSRFLQSGTGLPMRKMVCYGNGSSENTNSQIALMMGFFHNDNNPTLAKKLAWMWLTMGKNLNSFYSSTGLKVTPTVLTQDPLLSDADIPGFATIFRSSWGDPLKESAVFLLHGDANVDHSVFQRGSPSLYLLGEPVCISFGSLYTPTMVGPWVSASTYIPHSKVNTDPIEQFAGDPGGISWDTYTDYNLGCGDHGRYFNDTYTHSFSGTRCDVTCSFLVSDNWVRQMTFYKDDLACPVVRFRDYNIDPGDSVFTLHLMATGAVTKPDSSTMTPGAMTGTPFSIVNGACFKFVGQWGVSFDVYYFGPTAEAFVGVVSHTWHPTEESIQYGNATALAFEEKQYILRIKTAGPCDTVVVPYRTRPAGLNVAQTTGGLNLATTAVPTRFLAD